MSEPEGERCQRCGEVGEDRRTLWMACFYAMGELGLPFEEKTLFHANLEDLEETKDAAQRAVRSSGDLTPYGLFTLRVCKECRGDWMSAIKAWFNTAPRKESCGSGIFVQENGATIEITQEEWDRRHPEKTPFKVAP